MVDVLEDVGVLYVYFEEFEGGYNWGGIDENFCIVIENILFFLVDVMDGLLEIFEFVEFWELEDD